jgi:homocysteine S-methyltransferase
MAAMKAMKAMKAVTAKKPAAATAMKAMKANQMKRPAAAKGPAMTAMKATKSTKQAPRHVAGASALRRPAAAACSRDPLKRTDGLTTILDGGLATHLEALGQDIDHALWSAKCLISDPTSIQRAHADFFAAGADVAITASYQAHLDGFRSLGVSDAEATDAIKTSVSLARTAASNVRSEGKDRSFLVAGSVGPYGASLHNGAEYNGDYGEKMLQEAALMDWHRPRMQALIEAGCDMLACETVPLKVEAVAMARLLEELRVPGWITFSCRSEEEVCSGESFRDSVAGVAAFPHVVGAGVNCSKPQFVVRLVETCRQVLPPQKHVVVYPNSGEEWDGHSHAWCSGAAATADDQFVALARQWAAAGADVIGGCCRTTPATISMLHRAFREKQ